MLGIEGVEKGEWEKGVYLNGQRDCGMCPKRSELDHSRIWGSIRVQKRVFGQRMAKILSGKGQRISCQNLAKKEWLFGRGKGCQWMTYLTLREWSPRPTVEPALVLPRQRNAQFESRKLMSGETP